MLKRILPLIVLSGCGGAEPSPTWIDLSQGFQPRAPAESVAAWRGPDGRPYSLELDDGGGGLWIERRIRRDEWKREAQRAGFFSTERPLLGLAQHAATSRTRLFGGELEFQTATVRDATELLAQGQACYFLMPRRILIGLPEGQELPEEAVFAAHCDLGRSENGGWRARSGFLTADGLPLLAGQSYERTADLAPASQLTLATAAFGVELDAELRFEVVLDGETILDHVQSASSEVVHHRLLLGDAAREGAVLRFVVSGDPGAGTFVAPWVGPVPSGASLTTQGRPDIVLFLADTFRADNLALYGGTGELAPALDGFSEACLRFHRARSPASWTLPAMSSLLTGLYPPQHGATIEALSMSADLTTLAESLARKGYRTAAVTDSGFVAADYGMDQGFQIFQEYPAVDWSLGQTFDWALDYLDSSDGRPAFLLVHTYRTHYPYRQGADEDFSAWIETLKRAGIDDWKVGRPPEELLPYAEDFRSLYGDGVTALDQAFEAWWGELQERGWTDRGYFVFTSDHGEAFGEHVEFGHGGQLWGEKIRIPLLIHGPGVAPRDEHRAASLVDLAVTFAGMAGLPPERSWEGVDLLTLTDDRPLLSYNEGVLGDHLAIIKGAHKVLTEPSADALERGEFRSAFDLREDPGETDDLGAGAPAWALEMCRSHAGLIRELSVPRADARAAELSGAKQDELRAIGYGGD